MDILTTKTKNDVLDPLTVIIKLFIYAHKPIGTKLSILNNKIKIQEIGIFQGTIRTLFGDKKNDINIIIFPIIYACNTYLNEQNKTKFRKLFETACISFDKLKETYQGNEIIYNIDQLKTIINSFLNEDLTNTTSFMNNYNSAGGKIKQNIYIYLNSIWNEQRLNIVFGYLQEINETSSEELIFSLINSLNSYMDCVDLKINNLIANL
jgi:hypothetical protein